MNTYFTPGPTQPFPTIAKHIENAVKNEIISMAHRGKPFQDLYVLATDSLRKLMAIPSDYHIFFVASATECMERIVQNTVEKKSMHFTTGVFSERMYTIACDLKKDATWVKAIDGQAFDMQKIKIPKDIELLCFTHSETSTGVMTPLTDMYAAKEANPHALISIDIVSSAPYVDLDWHYIDCAFVSLQKGFGLPAGIAALVVSPKAIEKAKTLEKQGINIGPTYHNFIGMLYQSEHHEMVETPNILGLYLFGKVEQDMLKIGIETIRKQTDEKAKMMWDFFEKHKDKYELFVKDSKLRSPTVTVVNVKQGSMPLIDHLKKSGIIVGFGVLPGMKEKQIRITNFPTHTKEQVKELLSLL